MLHEFSIFAHPQKLASQNVSNPGIHKNEFCKKLSNLGLNPLKFSAAKINAALINALSVVLIGLYSFEYPHLSLRAS